MNRCPSDKDKQKKGETGSGSNENVAGPSRSNRPRNSATHVQAGGCGCTLCCTQGQTPTGCRARTHGCLHLDDRKQPCKSPSKSHQWKRTKEKKEFGGKEERRLFQRKKQTEPPTLTMAAANKVGTQRTQNKNGESEHSRPDGQGETHKPVHTLWKKKGYFHYGDVFLDTTPKAWSIEELMSLTL